MAPAKARSTGLGIECDGLELSRDQLPNFEESKIKKFPMVLFDPSTPCGPES
jgi:xanthine dioxygenase